MHYRTYVLKNKKGARPVRNRMFWTSATSNGGFVALITTIILSIILITITVSLNQSGFFVRSILLDAEYKEKSSALAEGCVHITLLKLANDPTYAGNETIRTGTDSCQIRPIKSGVPVVGQNTVETHAVFQEAATNLRIIANATSSAIISWNEISAF